ncbi:MAG: hypothetical protein AMJ91_02455 [candidate division Zixibacteria bacterium SM23_73_3]|nr:MAG: hypothetical protein AMJ91_02455 [candidate division Zixibacteria bacterium SM23_73_3]
MKKIFVILVVSIFVSSAAYGMDMSKHIGFGVWGGGIMSMNGSINADDNLSDVFGFYGFPALEIKYVIIDKVAVGINGGYGYLPAKDDKRDELWPELGDATPALNMPYVALNGTFNFGPMMKAEDNMLNPFVTAGVGMYMWYFSKNERTDKLSVMGEEFKASSFGFNVGGGVEYFAAEKLAVFGRVNYHMVMMEDKDKFGDDFGNQGFLTFGAGVTYYLFTESE